MKIEQFIAFLDSQKIPPEPPDHCGQALYDSKLWAGRERCLKRGMWALVYRSWVRVLAEWIGDRQVLEVMAGRGWLAKALTEEDVSVVATDDGSYDKRHSKCGPVYTVLPLDALSAIAQFGDDADMLVISWPPYGDEAATDALKVWGAGRPVVYIGEGEDMACAPDSFWRLWQKDASAPDIPLASWDGIHDFIEIGYYATP